MRIYYLLLSKFYKIYILSVNNIDIVINLN